MESYQQTLAKFDLGKTKTRRSSLKSARPSSSQFALASFNPAVCSSRPAFQQTSPRLSLPSISKAPADKLRSVSCVESFPYLDRHLESVREEDDESEDEATCSASSLRNVSTSFEDLNRLSSSKFYQSRSREMLATRVSPTTNRNLDGDDFLRQFLDTWLEKK